MEMGKTTISSARGCSGASDMDASASTPFDRGRGAIATKISEGSLFTRLACTKRDADAPVTRSPRGSVKFWDLSRWLWPLGMFWVVL